MSGLLDRDRSLLLVVDVQDKLVPSIAAADRMIRASRLLLDGATALGVPAAISEQYPRGLGGTVAALADENLPRFEKTSFSCTDDPGLRGLLVEGPRDQILLCGIEAHVCVLQTALGLIAAGRRVFVAADAVGSRAPSDKNAGLRRMAAAGVQIVTAEMALFEWTRTSADPAFRVISALIKAR